MNLIELLLNYGFIRNAFLAGIFISISASILGVFLVLKKVSLIGDGIAHATLAPISLSILLSISPLYLSVPFVILLSFFILYLTEKSNIYYDTVIGIFSSTGIAVAVTLASISKGFNVDLFSYLFGNILSVSDIELIISFFSSMLTILFITIMYRRLVSTIFDYEFTTSQGVNVKLINFYLVLSASLTIVIGIKIVGTLLISSLIIFPAVISLEISKSFKSTIIIAITSGIFIIVTGIIISLLLNLPTGATIVLTATVIFLTVVFLKKVFKFG